MMKRVGMAILLAFVWLAGGFYVCAQESEPIPIEFKKAGGGQFIYCNNPENINYWNLSTKENPYCTYMMKNEKLKPDRYSVFFCFYNCTNFDVEPDIEFAGKDAVITIESVGYALPQKNEFWDCVGAWSDLMGISIRNLNGYQQYVPYKGETKLPVTLKLGEASEWISRHIYNYDVVKPRSTFNMLVNFTIESGEVDVNFAALKHYSITGDRSHHNPDADAGAYHKDTSVKGIETDTLPMVEADLNVQIDSSIKDGDSILVQVFNQFHNDGNVVPYWMTNINPSRDQYAFSKDVAAGSDMLSLRYRDASKRSYYGSQIPDQQKDDLWIFDIYHHDTTKYEPGMPWKEEAHIPNAFTSKTLDRNNLPNVNWEFNLGNFGVTTRYHLSVTNHDTKPRSLNYMLDTALASNIVIVRDEQGNILNPYTHQRENAFALNKPINPQKEECCLFSTMVEPGETQTFLLDVILPTNCYGGMLNALKVDSKCYLTFKGEDEFPVFKERYPYSNVFYNGESYMKWEEGALYETDQGQWVKCQLPSSAQAVFGSREQEFEIRKTPWGYAARFAGWDAYPYIQTKQLENKLYLFNEKLELLESKIFPDYIYQMEVINGQLLIRSDQPYAVKQDGSSTALGKKNPAWVTNGKAALCFLDQTYYWMGETQNTAVVFERESPKEIFSAGDLFVYKKSWKQNFYDQNTKNIISVSENGVAWMDYVLPDHFLDLQNITHLEGKIILDCRYEVIAFEEPVWPEHMVMVSLNGHMLAPETPAVIVNDRTMVPFRFFFEQLDAQVSWDEKPQQVFARRGNTLVVMEVGNTKAWVNGEEKVLDAPPYIENGRTRIPLRFLSEALGYQVSWDQVNSIASVTVPTVNGTQAEMFDEIKKSG